MAVCKATVKTFDELLDTDYVVVDFYGTFCGPCKALAPVFEEASGDFVGIHFLQVNTDHENELRDRFQIDGVPTLIFFRNGKPVHQAKGYMSREKLNEHISVLLYGNEEGEKKNG